MKVLVVGNGGREHALAYKLRQSAGVDRVFATRPNAGMARLTDAVDIAPTDVAALVRFARSEGVDLTVPGPEAPLCAGLVDAFDEAGLYAFGPSGAAARMEGSKAFAKAVMARTGVPTAEHAEFDDVGAALAHVAACPLPVVVKADGLAAGKGVRICGSREEAADAVRDLCGERIYGDAGSRLVIEEYLEGTELSFIALVDGDTIVPLDTSQDHKRLLDHDEGPNTGGMGAFSPAPAVDEALVDRVIHEIMAPTLLSLSERKIRFRGFLYAGLMIGPRGPKVLEFNVRLGDPETQPLLMRLGSDLAALLLAPRDGGLPTRIDWDPRPALCVVLASEGYPAAPVKGRPIAGLDAVNEGPDLQVFHAGTRLGDDGQVLTNGGRVLGVTALGADLEAARRRAYAAADQIHFEGKQLRRDIAAR